MSATSAPETAPAPSEQPMGQPDRRRRGLGSLRSMVISMVVIAVAVLAWVAMVPRVRAIDQPAVDVAAVARQVRQQSGWAISQPKVPAGWKATNVRLDSATEGIRTWHAGYLTPEGHYLSIDQTARAGATGTWISAKTSNGQAQGTLAAAGTTWRKVSSPDVLQRSLISTPGASNGSAAGDLVTVLSGTAPYGELAQFAQMLRPVPSG